MDPQFIGGEEGRGRERPGFVKRQLRVTTYKYSPRVSLRFGWGTWEVVNWVAMWRLALRLWSLGVWLPGHVWKGSWRKWFPR
jgi:hypothetical protein